MYTGYTDPTTRSIIDEELSNIENNNIFMFKFSSLKNELSLIVNETIPIKINEESFNRFSLCNETKNMFFLTNKCN